MDFYNCYFYPDYRGNTTELCYDDMILRASRPRYSAKSHYPEIKIITLIAPFRRGGWERGAEWRELYFKATTF